MLQPDDVSTFVENPVYVPQPVIAVTNEEQEQLPTSVLPKDIYNPVQNVSTNNNVLENVDLNDNVAQVEEVDVVSDNQVQLQMRHDIENWTKDLLHVLKDLNDPGNSQVCDDYVKNVHGILAKLPMKPPRPELKKITRRAKDPVSRTYFPAKPKDSPKVGRPKKEVQKPDLNLLWISAVENAPIDDHTRTRWRDVMSLKKQDLLLSVQHVYKSKDQQGDFFKTLKEAKKFFKCFECNHFDDKHLDSDYIFCECCGIWRHKICTPKYPFDPADIGKSAKSVPNAFKCRQCNSKLVPDLPDNSSGESDGEKSSGDDFVGGNLLTHKQRKRR